MIALRRIRASGYQKEIDRDPIKAWGIRRVAAFEWRHSSSFLRSSYARERECVYWYSYSIHSVLTHLPFGLSSRWALSYELFPTMIPPSRLLLEGDSNPMPICLIFQARRVVVAVHMCSDCSCVSFCPRWPRAHLPWGRFIHAEDCLVMFWSSAPSDVSLNLVHLISLFLPAVTSGCFLAW